MFNITLIAMGKLKEKFYLSAAEAYCKRLKGYCNFQIIELPEHRLPEDPSPAEISAGLEKEAELIFSKIPKGAWFCVFTPEGKVLSSEAFADKLKPFLTEDELAYFRRGKNAHTHAAPKSATPQEYAKATGLETLFGYLYLSGREERCKELFRILTEECYAL